jgi:hypothetical protein
MPDPMEPVVITRDFRLLRTRNKGAGRQSPLDIKNFALIELVPHCLYEVPSHGPGVLADVPELAPGRILSRNLSVSERLNGDGELGYGQQCFISFKTVYTARRGMAHAETRGRSVELPALRTWDDTFNWMVKTSWTLHLVGEGEKQEYVLVAAALLDQHGRVIDKRKVEALRRSLQAGDLKDSIGRFNPGRIPLIIFAGQKQLAKRIQGVRGISRRMSFREAVLEVYIDRLRLMCRQIADSQLHRLQSRKLFGDDRLLPPQARGAASSEERSTKTVLKEAGRLDSVAARLETVVTKPFDRSIKHTVRDLRDAAKTMVEAAEVAGTDGPDVAATVMLRVRDPLMRVYHSMKLRELHWQLEELVLQTAVLMDRSETISASRKRVWGEELRFIHRRLTRPDPMTGKLLDHGFSREVRASVFPHVHLAIVHLMRQHADGGPDLKNVDKELRKACAPL